MSVYEKPVAEIVSFVTEGVMGMGGASGNFSVSGGVEEGAP